MKDIDFSAGQYHGRIVLYPETDAAEAWADENADEAVTLSGGFLVDEAAMQAIADAGLVIEGFNDGQ